MVKAILSHLILLFLSVSSVKSAINNNVEVNRLDFPDGFLFGIGTSAYQIEGAYLEDGAGQSNWDKFSDIKGNIQNGDNGFVAADHYHRYMEDIELLHSLGVSAYRFSISWSRVLPKGKFGDVNQAAIIFYNNIIDNILLKGIEPFVTIHHFDFPQELESRYGGWLSPLMQFLQENSFQQFLASFFGYVLCRDDFVHFAETCFKNFGDRVKFWATINEPNLFAQLSYEIAVYPPARCSPPFGNCSTGNSDIEPLIAVHNMLLAHAAAVKLYREQFKLNMDAMIGIVVNTHGYKPMTENEDDKKATNRAFAFNIAWVLDPVVFGDYPPEMKHYHGSELPIFSSKEKALLRDSVDYIGINHYGSFYAKDCIHSFCICNESSCFNGSDRAIQGFVLTTAMRDGVSIGEPTGLPKIFVYPSGIEDTVNSIKERYHNRPMFITENGYSPPDNEDNYYMNDVKRIDYHKSYLAHLSQSIRDGADVCGYFVWTLVDDFEWSAGYEAKFGLYRLEAYTLKRIPKLSATWYRDFLINNSAPFSYMR